MITFTDRAKEAVLSFMGEGEDALEALRIQDGADPGAPSRFELTLVSTDERTDRDQVVDLGPFKVYVDADSSDALAGAVVDFVERVNEAGFEVRTAQAPAPPEGPMAERVRAVLDERINPAVASHGGAIELVAVEGSEVFIEMTGGCQGCAMSRMTLRQGVERMLKEVIPEISAVHDATDHTRGANPYFTHPV
ncbi:MAG: NifU family protein [Gemmatimonadota bacterium]